MLASHRAHSCHFGMRSLIEIMVLTRAVAMPFQRFIPGTAHQEGLITKKAAGNLCKQLVFRKIDTLLFGLSVDGQP